ncbi:hypothetical protein L208DRAFT_1380229 [Tricholoma matsutake]|nr:hypothetical protein L208DRAFT_1380229 [Tricholoma matsutake 945]
MALFSVPNDLRHLLSVMGRTQAQTPPPNAIVIAQPIPMHQNTEMLTIVLSREQLTIPTNVDESKEFVEDSDVERPAKKTSSQGNRKAREGDIQIRRDTEVLLEGKTKGKAMGKLMRGEKGKEKAMETLEDVKMVDDAMEVDRPMAVKIEVDKPKSTIPGHSVGVIQIKPMSPRKSRSRAMSITGQEQAQQSSKWSRGSSCSGQGVAEMNQGSEDLMAIIEPSTDHMPGPADIAVPALGQVPSESSSATATAECKEQRQQYIQVHPPTIHPTALYSQTVGAPRKWPAVQSSVTGATKPANQSMTRPHTNRMGWAQMGLIARHLNRIEMTWEGWNEKTEGEQERDVWHTLEKPGPGCILYTGATAPDVIWNRWNQTAWESKLWINVRTTGWNQMAWDGWNEKTQKGEQEQDVWHTPERPGLGCTPYNGKTVPDVIWNSKPWHRI